jgi:hypothetical protein
LSTATNFPQKSTPFFEGRAANSEKGCFRT